MKFLNKEIYKNYLKKQFKNEISYEDLPEYLNIEIKTEYIEQLKKESFKLKTLKNKNIKNLNKIIKSISFGHSQKIYLNLPINLETSQYVELYSLLLSEGSVNTEFSLNVPEFEFHQIFEKNLKKIFNKNLKIRKDLNSNFPRSRAPQFFSKIIPIPLTIPKFIFENKEFAKIYLQTAFEAEGCALFDRKRKKKYIKLSRSTNVSNLINYKKYKEGDKFYLNQIKEKFNYNEIKNKPPITLLGEHLMLFYVFGIESTLNLDSIRINKVDNRVGKVSAKWFLQIYSNNLKKFIEKINFISERKKKITQSMLKTNFNNEQFTSLKIMFKISKNLEFTRKDFVNEMKKLGYISPQKYLWDYSKNLKLIKRIERGKYKIICSQEKYL